MTAAAHIGTVDHTFLLHQQMKKRKEKRWPWCCYHDILHEGLMRSIRTKHVDQYIGVRVNRVVRRDKAPEEKRRNLLNCASSNMNIHNPFCRLVFDFLLFCILSRKKTTVALNQIAILSKLAGLKKIWDLELEPVWIKKKAKTISISLRRLRYYDSTN